MGLAEIPLLLALVGLAAYVVLGGADFGAGLWYMLLPGERRRPLRDHTYHAMGPVWEANHVWLIFVLVVVWTAYPVAFGAIFSTLYIPLFAAALGIIIRGACYALRSTVSSAREERILGALFGVSSVLTPFALGAAVGGIASGRVPLGNAAGDPVDAWLNPTSIAVGLIAVATSAYLAAVWLTGDARRAGRDDLAEPFRARALASAAVAGAGALGGLAVLRGDAERIYDGLTSGTGLVALLASVVAGAATALLVARRRPEPARWSAAVAVGAIVAGWALAQRPQLLPGLTVEEAAAGDATIVALLISIAVGSAILVPSLVLLFSLVLRGRFDEPVPAAPVEAATPVTRRAPLGIVAAVCTGLGAPLLFFSEGGPILALGVVLLLVGLTMVSALLVARATDDDPLRTGP
ncbi:MAG TPA: cytochrome d ubiquinol oxidase subunit II [Solirubrobacteraceae bacterium]|nr:cytochrome d ubiquinol oxidase subunit II [Solirubrobacteraceae bacterium]